MKKILRFLIGSSDKKAAPLPQKRVAPAHELALKQVIARREQAARLEEQARLSERARLDEQAKLSQAASANGAAASEVPRAPAPTAASDGGAVARNDGASQSSPPKKDRRQEKPKRAPVRDDAGLGTGRRIYEPKHQLADISAGVELKTMHSLADAGSLASELRRTRRSPAKAHGGMKRQIRRSKQPLPGRAGEA